MRYKITVLQVFDRLPFVKHLRCGPQNLSLAECVDKVDKLDINLDFAQKGNAVTEQEKDEIVNKFGTAALLNVEEIPAEPGYWFSTEQSPELLDALEWRKNLSEQDQKRLELILINNVPKA